MINPLGDELATLNRRLGRPGHPARRRGLASGTPQASPSGLQVVAIACTVLAAVRCRLRHRAGA